MNWLVSYPRSGNTWLRLFFEGYTGLASRGIYGENHDPPLLYSTTETCVRKIHRLIEIDPNFKHHHTSSKFFTLSEKDTIIVILRNPEDAIASNLKWGISLNIPKEMNDFLWNIELFIRFTGRKTMIFYEDLLDDFKKAIIRAIETYGMPVDKDKIKSFSENNNNNFETVTRYLLGRPNKKPENVFGDMEFKTRSTFLSPSVKEQMRFFLLNIPDADIIHFDENKERKYAFDYQHRDEIRKIIDRYIKSQLHS